MMCDRCHPRLGPRHEDYVFDPDEIKRVYDAAKAAIEKEKKSMEATLRCKMRVAEVTHVKDADGSTTQERVKLAAVYGPEGSENAQWSKWTPSANFEIYINNPDAMNKLASGHEFYLDFTPVTK